LGKKSKCLLYAVIDIPEKTYDLLKNHASTFDIDIHDLASVILEHGLNDPKILDKALSSLKEKHSVANL